MDYMTIVEEWCEQSYCELLVSCGNDKIRITDSYYVDKERCIALRDGLKRITTVSSMESLYWESGKKQLNQTPVFALNAKRQDAIGHFRIDVYMEIDNTIINDANNYCHFSLLLETCQIDKLIQSLSMIDTNENTMK